jgi:hypothetical protein
MIKPYLQINIQNGVLNVLKIADPSDESYLILDIDIEDLKSLSPADAAYRIGGTVLNLLSTWNPSDFGGWSVPAVFEGLGKDGK